MMILTEQQNKALEMVQRHKLSILTGVPGSGKTTITKHIVDHARSQKMKIKIASPSGKAAKVISVACEHPATTIHKMLDPRPEKDKSGKLTFKFLHGITNPLVCDLLIIDECSMIGNSLMADLLQAVNPAKTKLLLIGDPNQLPSIQPGNVLRDLIACGSDIPCTELTTIFRNSGKIVWFCQAIRNNNINYAFPQPPDDALDLGKGDNYLHVECSSLQGIHDNIIRLATVNMPKRGYDVNDIQCLSPVNSKTEVSCDGLNMAIQNIVNPQPEENIVPGRDDNGLCLRLKSRVINIKNIYDAVDKNSSKKEVLLNGDIGEIIYLEKKTMVVHFENPERNIIVSKRNNHLRLAYALTIHRAQGSQFKCVIMPVHSAFSFSFNRAMLYTAASRASEILITVGEAKAIRKAIGATAVYNRKTLLSGKLNNMLLEQL